MRSGHSSPIAAASSTAALERAGAPLAANNCDGNDVHVHGSGQEDGRDSIVICEGGDCKDELFDDIGEHSVLDITADDGDVRA